MGDIPCTDVTFTVTEQYINIHLGGATVCQFGIGEDGGVILAFPNKFTLSNIALRDGTMQGVTLRPLRAAMVYQETEPDMALPRYQRTMIEAPRAPSVVRVRVSENGKVAKRDVEDVVEALVQSLVDEPNQTKTRQAAISREIAQRMGIQVMSIAGIRASLTKNAYGDLEDMKRAVQRART